MDIKTLIDSVHKDEQNFNKTLHLTANENILSKIARSFLSSKLSYRYLVGDLSSRLNKQIINFYDAFLCKGAPGVASLEEAATLAVNDMFHSEGVDFRPTSGLSATLVTSLTFSNVGDNVYSLGSHFATKHYIKRMGRNYLEIAFKPDSFDVDYEKFREQIKEKPADLVLLEPGTPLFPMNLQEIRNIVGEKTIIIYDGSHALGLIAADHFQQPFAEGCDIIQANTHKTFPGPQKGMIISKTKELADKVSKSIDGGLVSNSHVNTSIALYITCLEMHKYAEDYSKQILSNTQALGKSLQNDGFKLVNIDGNFSNSEQILIEDADNFNICTNLHLANISTNARSTYGRNVIRIGTQEITRRGMKEEDMEEISSLIKKIAFDKASTDVVKKEVAHLNEKYQNISYSFDEELGFND